MNSGPAKPSPPDLPDYVVNPLESQSPEKLEQVAEYAGELATWKRAKRKHDLEQKRDEEGIDEDELEDLEDRGISIDPTDYEDVPASGAYITIKETKPGYHYYYWQWRDGDSWKNEYIGPVNPRED
ncbi:hypothetical protein RBH26_14670 [Natronolimnohabitans sp. A-GB9]|uniref:hypothetical protein n=1 Tax=Natronolimnohabitans sp. A-GB9 TaxID=3069757 RepID=UPI0027B407E7|nr:hypothetical protein [Natronolimnohabitans sp. A-GB9]MDQ2051720.1 hypothetical protein [Natronolimnohabitans sp. A-GB9]